MTEKEKTWVTVLVILFTIAGLYSWRVYSSLWLTREGYLYDPSTDRVFLLRMRPAVNALDRWEPFIPFRSRSFTEIDQAYHLGHLKGLRDGADTLGVPAYFDRPLRIEHVADWIEFKRGGYLGRDKSYWIQYFPAWGYIEGSESLRKTLMRLRESTNADDRDVTVCDAVVTSRESPSSWERGPLRAEVIRNAVLIKDSAALVFGQVASE